MAGFAGSTADCFTLMERLERKLEEHPGQLTRACVDLAKAWRTDKYLRRLEVKANLLTLSILFKGSKGCYFMVIFLSPLACRRPCWWPTRPSPSRSRAWVTCWSRMMASLPSGRAAHTPLVSPWHCLQLPWKYRKESTSRSGRVYHIIGARESRYIGLGSHISLVCILLGCTGLRGMASNEVRPG